ncbi:hypothetical Protein YC6258_05467 [Gynuella sunshinyii YC6258]|uniref:Uncharacterized protein n=1 Tax=Gynuella sunshinyii YC6258 TaxID=1445510 RepID=A0A0C5VDU5_9GAMM|nr:hypothetical Protein YC6258_05467 [Gynuella sunshinyii YC6258]
MRHNPTHQYRPQQLTCLVFLIQQLLDYHRDLGAHQAFLVGIEGLQIFF